jgi:hypothetical protein
MKDRPMPGEETSNRPVAPLQESVSRLKRRRKGWFRGGWRGSIPGVTFSPLRLFDRLGLIAVRWLQGVWKWLGLHIDLLFRMALLLAFGLAVAAVVAVVKVSLDRTRALDALPWG